MPALGTSPSPTSGALILFTFEKLTPLASWKPSRKGCFLSLASQQRISGCELQLHGEHFWSCAPRGWWRPRVLPRAPPQPPSFIIARVPSSKSLELPKERAPFPQKSALMLPLMPHFVLFLTVVPLFSWKSPTAELWKVQLAAHWILLPFPLEGPQAPITVAPFPIPLPVDCRIDWIASSLSFWCSPKDPTESFPQARFWSFLISGCLWANLVSGATTF